MSLTAKIAVALEVTLTKALDLGNARDPLRISKILNLTNGTGAGKAQQVFHDQRTLEGGASEDLDLSGGFDNAFGESVSFTDIKALYIEAASTNTDDLLVGGATANGFATMFGESTDKLVLKPGGAVLLFAPGADGYAVTADTGDLLKVADGGAGGATYDIVVIGEGTVS